MKWLNYHHLHYFYKIAECGSISKAADELRIGQPALSIQLKDLEENLGILFERRSRSLFLTERGKIVYKYAKEIFSKGDELLGVLDRGQLALQRELVVGAKEGVPKAIISNTIQRLQKKTKLKIRVKEGEAPMLLDELLEGKMDLMILDHELTHVEKTIVYFPLGEERIFFWGSDKYKSLAKGFPLSLEGVPLIISSVGHPLRQAVENYFTSHSLNLEIAVESPDTALTKELVTSGVGVTALGERTVQAWAKVGRLHKIGSLPYVQKYSLGTLKKFLKDPLSDLVREEFHK